MAQGKSIYRRVAELQDERRGFVLATLAEIKGSAPRDAGAQMIVHADGETEFTIGGGTFEAEVVKDARALLEGRAREEGKGDSSTALGMTEKRGGMTEKSRGNSGEAGSAVLKEYQLTPGKLDLYCAGTASVLFQVFNPAPHLLILGGGHIAQALSRLAGETGLFQVTVVDDRAEFASPARHPAAHRVALTDAAYKKDVPDVDSETYVVIVTRDHPTDRELVKRYAGAPAAFIGMVGSETKWRTFRMELKKQGVPEEHLDRVHAPIGLPIGGKLPEEIAVSILAQLVQVKNSEKGRGASDEGRGEGTSPRRSQSRK